MNDVVMATSEISSTHSIPAATSFGHNNVYRGVLLATLDTRSDTLQRGSDLNPHIPFELIDLPKGKARSFPARTLRFRGYNVQESREGELCAQMEKRVLEVLPSSLASPVPKAQFLPRTRAARVSFMDIKFSSEVQYRAVLSQKPHLMLSTISQGVGSVQLELAFEGPNIDDDIFVMQVSQLPDNQDKLYDLECVARKVGTILDVWKQVRDLPSAAQWSHPTGTFVVVCRLYKGITHWHIGDLPGWLVCNDQGYMLSYQGRRPYCNHCNWQSKNFAPHLAQECPLTTEAAENSKRGRNRKRKARRKLRSKAQRDQEHSDASDDENAPQSLPMMAAGPSGTREGEGQS